MLRIASIALALALALPAAASAEECQHVDLQGQFTVAFDCEGLQTYNPIGNELSRIWLAGPWGEFHISEVPSPNNTAKPEFVMSNLARKRTKRRSPEPPQPVTLAGVEGLRAMERKLRTSSRSWVFQWEGRTLIARAVSYGKRAEREERLDKISEDFEANFKAAE